MTFSAALRIAERARGVAAISSGDGFTAFFVSNFTRGSGSPEGDGEHELRSLAWRKTALVTPPSRLWYVSATILPPTLVRLMAAFRAVTSAPGSSFTALLSAMNDFVAA